MNTNVKERDDARIIECIAVIAQYPTIESYIEWAKTTYKFNEEKARAGYIKMSILAATALANGYKMPEV